MAAAKKPFVQRINRKVTPEEINQARDYANEVLARATIKEPIDREACILSVRRVYKALGKPPPKKILLAKSPLAASRAVSKLGKEQRKVSYQVQITQFVARLREHVTAHMMVPRTISGEFVRVRDELRPVINLLRGEVGTRANPAGADVSWLAYLSFVRKLGIVYSDKDNEILDALLDAFDLGWWYPFSEVAVVTDRPTAIGIDPQGRLHGESGPALAYSDGSGFYMWHGTRVPKDLIETNWSVLDIFKEQNTEIRRCAIERMGWDQFALAAELKTVGKPVPDPGNPGHSLALYDVPQILQGVGWNRRAFRVLVCTNASPELDGTWRSFGLTVPATIKSPLEAAAWTFGLTPQEYQKLEHAC